MRLRKQKRSAPTSATSFQEVSSYCMWNMHDLFEGINLASHSLRGVGYVEAEGFVGPCHRIHMWKDVGPKVQMRQNPAIMSSQKILTIVIR